MQDSIFIKEFPLVRTDKELKQVQDNYSKLEYDLYFIASGCIKDRKAKFDRLWSIYKTLPVSSAVKKKFLLDVKKEFHKKTWEMYIGSVFLSKEIEVKPEFKKGGPDFIINKKLYIECVACEKGTGEDRVPDMFVANSCSESKWDSYPSDKIILRITNSIGEKIKQYNQWKDKDWFDENASFIIAINTGDFGYLEDPNMPNVVKALFGFEFMKINLENGKMNYSFREEIVKKTGSLVPVNLFIKGKCDFISGVLFSNNTVLNCSDKIGEDCIFVDNPFAKNPINKDFANIFNSWDAQKENDGIKLTKKY